MGRRVTVAVVGRTGAGKTALCQALAGSEPPGVRLLDTPGDPELAGARIAALVQADAVLLVLPARGGLDAFTVRLWQQCAEQGLPRAVVLSQVDLPGADVDEALALSRRMLDEQLCLLHVPIHDDDGSVAGLLDLQSLGIDLGPGRPGRPAESEHRALVENLREDLLETVLADADDQELFDRYLAGALEGTEAAVAQALHQGVGRGSLLPILVTSPAQVGLAQVRELLSWWGPRDRGPAQTPDARGSAARAWGLSEPFHPQVVGAGRPGTALLRAVDGDQSLRLEIDDDQVLLWSLGPRHAAAVLEAAALPATAAAVPVPVPGAERICRLAVTVPAVLARPVARALQALGAQTDPPGPTDEQGLSTVAAALPRALLPRLAPTLGDVAAGTAQVRWQPGR